MKKIIRLTENELASLIKQVINEQNNETTKIGGYELGAGVASIQKLGGSKIKITFNAPTTEPVIWFGGGENNFTYKVILKYDPKTEEISLDDFLTDYDLNPNKEREYFEQNTGLPLPANSENFSKNILEKIF
jgi:hypothetical protein